MKVKLTNSLAGDRFDFRAGQVIQCSKTDGERLIAHEVAIEARDGEEVEGKLVEEEPLRKRRGRPAKPPGPEKADVAAPEAAVTEGAPEHCQGETKAGNPCKRAPLEDSPFCAAHQGGDEGEAAEGSEGNAE